MASADDSIAIGNRANSNPANQDRGSGQFSIAVGRESWAKGTDNISIGHKAETNSSGDSIAMGRESKQTKLMQSLLVHKLMPTVGAALPWVVKQL